MKDICVLLLFVALSPMLVAAFVAGMILAWVWTAFHVGFSFVTGRLQS